MGRGMTIIGDGHQTSSFTRVSDLVRASAIRRAHECSGGEDGDGKHCVHRAPDAHLFRAARSGYIHTSGGDPIALEALLGVSALVTVAEGFAAPLEARR